MSVVTKLGLLALAAAGCLAFQEFHLAGASSSELTAAAMQQFQNSDAAAESLRLTDGSKNWWIVTMPLCLVLFAGLLFWQDVEKLWKQQGPKQ